MLGSMIAVASSPEIYSTLPIHYITKRPGEDP